MLQKCYCQSNGVIVFPDMLTAKLKCCRMSRDVWDAAAISGTLVQVQTPMDDEVDIGQSIPYQHGQFPRQDSASSALPAREAAAGFKGALKKVANGIAGDASLTSSVNMTAGAVACPC